MKIGVDAQLAPSLAPWLAGRFGVEALAVRDLGLHDARDRKIYFHAREADALVLTKDADFVELLRRHGPPPRILWLTSGNTSNARVRALVEASWPRILQLLERGESLVEIRNAQ